MTRRLPRLPCLLHGDESAGGRAAERRAGEDETGEDEIRDG
ncbi:hypothetical protein ACIP93_13980 [Streptomyces sp. NPDC088745]